MKALKSHGPRVMHRRTSYPIRDKVASRSSTLKADMADFGIMWFVSLAGRSWWCREELQIHAAIADEHDLPAAAQSERPPEPEVTRVEPLHRERIATCERDAWRGRGRRACAPEPASDCATLNACQRRPGSRCFGPQPHVLGTPVRPPGAAELFSIHVRLSCCQPMPPNRFSKLFKVNHARRQSGNRAADGGVAGRLQRVAEARSLGSAFSRDCHTPLATSGVTAGSPRIVPDFPAIGLPSFSYSVMY